MSSVVEEVSEASYWVDPKYSGHREYFAPGPFHVAFRSEEYAHRLVGGGPVVVVVSGCSIGNLFALSAA